MHGINFKLFSRRMGKAFVLTTVLTYLVFHMLNGDRGVYAYFKEMHQQEKLALELAEVRAERQMTEIRVAGLRSESLDLDLLDEQLRRMLGMIGDNEKMVFMSPSETMQP